jgi:peptide deformylase
MIDDNEKAFKVLIEPRLQVAEKWDFEEYSGNITELRYNLINTCRMYGAPSLSAPLIGKNVAVLHVMGEPHVSLINPKIVHSSYELAIATESSPTFPGLSVKVTRPLTIRVRYNKADGSTTTSQFTGGIARLIQHEICHIEGRYFWEDSNFLHKNRAVKDWKIIKRKLSRTSGALPPA